MIAFSLLTRAEAVCDETYGDLWNMSWVTEPRNDLRCKLDEHCRKEPSQVQSEEFDKCCTCRSCAVWEGKEIELFIEYISVLGRSLVLPNQAPSKPVIYKIEQTNAEMTEIPSNLCNWDHDTNLEDKYPAEFTNIKQFWGHIVKLNFENNKIRKLPDLNCLVRLDEINLRNNQLTHISNTSFTNLTRLRYIYLSGNLIKEMDPNILTSKYLMNLFYADFSNNEMTELDVSNMFGMYPFCKIAYNSNNITDLVNEADFTLNSTIPYGPGFVDISSNKVNTWPDFETIFKLDDIIQLGYLFSFGFYFGDIQLVCDCNIERFMSHVYDIFNTVWRDYMDITCAAPDTLAGKKVYEVELEKFICLVETDCDPRCTCIDQPYKDTLYIDCSNSDLTTLPEIPYSRYSHYVSLNVSNNQIATITNVSYLSRISMLDISRNNLVEINNNVANLLENATYIDISNNPKLRQLPQLFQYHNVCSRNMQNLQISCDCRTRWIEKWVHSRPCETHDNLFLCEIAQAGIKPAFEFAQEDLDCSPNGFPFLLEILIAAAIIILILIGTPIYIFRYELLILCLRMRKLRRTTVLPLNKYDVFLSFNDVDDDITKWVNYKLESELIKAKYKVFQPSRDVAFGAERDSEIIKVLSTTRNFLVVVSDSYLQEADEGMRSWTENEWKYGWNNFKADRSKNIVLVNFDHVSSFDVIHPQIKAFLRVGCTVDFKNQNGNIMQEIFEKLGKPLHMPQMTNKALENKKQKLEQFELFTIVNNDDHFLQHENIIKKIEADDEQQDANIITRFHHKQMKQNNSVDPRLNSRNELSKGKLGQKEFKR
ncbi:uncharacterized protein LOC123531284 [Mercenaria mercenaria]|uniref:uncharacterized protein LOC123531284 n=1 Tax=Mercenaria mercenaria TaxID=6596 RepID=UPI00234FA227|nr:uncharacterized protein LOC123531284 [Mercenaria mercenaria]